MKLKNKLLQAVIMAPLFMAVTSFAEDYPEPQASVTGHAFSKEKAVLAGDLVQWDVINTVGNQGLLSRVTDTLPDELAFVPDSPRAVEFYEVNADGSIGREITSQWQVAIKGQTMTAYPKDAMRYRYTDAVAELAQPTRFMYRVYSVVRPGVPSGVELVNRESLVIQNPPKVVDGERVDGEEIELTSDAKVYTPEYTRPSVIKQESQDGGETWVEDMTLTSHVDNYLYRIVVAIPPKMAQESLEIYDDMADIIDADGISVYWGDQAWTTESDLEEVTDAFEVTEAPGSDFSIKASKDFIKQLRQSKELTYVTVVSTKTDLQVEDVDATSVQSEVAKFPGNKVPNQALASVDDVDMHSNTVYVRLPEGEVVVPEEPEEPEVPVVPEEPQAPEVPVEPEVPELPEEPTEPTVSEIPVESSLPEKVEPSKVTEEPKVSETKRGRVLPATPKASASESKPKTSQTKKAEVSKSEVKTTKSTPRQILPKAGDTSAILAIIPGIVLLSVVVYLKRKQ
jgi:hypothetical protein